MSVEDNKDIIRRYFYEVINCGNMNAFGEFVAENVVGYDATDLEPKAGFESVKQVMMLFRTAFPDIECPIYDLLAEDDKVAVRWGLRGTHSSEFMNVPATGNTVDVSGIIIYRLKNRKIVEYWGNFDTLGLMRQIGAL